MFVKRDEGRCNSLITCVTHFLAAPTPTTFLAATDTYSYLEGGFEVGLKVWLHLPAVHSEMLTFLMITEELAWNLIL